MAAGKRGSRRDWSAFLAGVDPGQTRLRSAGTAIASMLLAVGVVTLVRRQLAPEEPVTMVLLAALLAMFAGIAVREPTLGRRRVSTALLLAPAGPAIAAGTLLAPHRVVVCTAFIVLAAGAVWLRRFGPRADALGMITFVSFYSTQFLRAHPDQVGWLVLAALIGIACTLLLSGFVLVERPGRKLRRLLGALQARAHGVVRSADLALAELPAIERGESGDRVLHRLRHASDRLTQTSTVVEDELDQDHDEVEGADEPVAVKVFDLELALSGLALSTRTLVQLPEHRRDDALEDPRPTSVAALRAGLDQLARALHPQTEAVDIRTSTDAARAAVQGEAQLADPHQERVRSSALSLIGIADSVDALGLGADAGAHRTPRAADSAAAQNHTATHPEPTTSASAADAVAGSPPDQGRSARRIAVTDRQALQVAVAAALAIGVTGLLAPERWYWAVLTAFVIFQGTKSRSDLLARGGARVVGTVIGAVGGTGLAMGVAGHPRLAVVLLFACAFLVLYVAPVSPLLQAVFITGGVALLLGINGSFDPQLLLTRMEETAIGVVCGVVAAFLILPRRSREAFADAARELVDAMDRALQAITDRATDQRGVAPGAGGVGAGAAIRGVQSKLDELRERTRTLGGRFPGRTTTYRRALRVLTVCDHYLAALSRSADRVATSAWSTTLPPATDQIRDNLGGLGRLLAGERGPFRMQPARPLIEAVESDTSQARAAPDADGHRAGDGEVAGEHTGDATAFTAWLLRLDEAVVALATDLGAIEEPTGADQVGSIPSTTPSS